MNAKDFVRLGVPLGKATRRATDFVAMFILGGGDKERMEEEVKAIVANPSVFTGDPLRGEASQQTLAEAGAVGKHQPDAGTLRGDQTHA